MGEGEGGEESWSGRRRMRGIREGEGEGRGVGERLQRQSRVLNLS